MRKSIHIICTIIIIFIANQLFAQINTDSLFMVAIEQSRAEDYDNAIINAKKVLEIHPDRADVAVFIANVYAWDRNYNLAKFYINSAYDLQPLSEPLYDSWLNILLWNAEYQQVLRTANVAEENRYPNKYNLMYKRLIAYKYLNEFDAAADMFKDGKNEDLLDSAQINGLARELILKSKTHTATAYYSVDFFDNNDPKPQHLAYLDYSFKIKKNTLIFRLNYANRYDDYGLQLEADYYQLLKKSKYLYFNYGASIYNDLFPKHRAGAEFYFPLKRNFEASIGARYMNFPNNNVYTITGHISKYVSYYWIALRPYYTFQEQGNSISLVANARRYGKSTLSYWGIELGYGNSPDERYILDPSGDYFNLNSYRIKLEKDFMVGKADDLKISFGYSYEETAKSLFRARYTVEIIYKHRL